MHVNTQTRNAYDTSPLYYAECAAGHYLLFHSECAPRLGDYLWCMRCNKGQRIIRLLPPLVFLHCQTCGMHRAYHRAVQTAHKDRSRHAEGYPGHTVALQYRVPDQVAQLDIEYIPKDRWEKL